LRPSYPRGHPFYRSRCLGRSGGEAPRELARRRRVNARPLEVASRGAVPLKLRYAVRLSAQEERARPNLVLRHAAGEAAPQQSTEVGQGIVGGDRFDADAREAEDEPRHDPRSVLPAVQWKSTGPGEDATAPTQNRMTDEVIRAPGS
jgi:hypothetical protein